MTFFIIIVGSYAVGLASLILCYQRKMNRPTSSGRALEELAKFDENISARNVQDAEIILEAQQSPSKAPGPSMSDLPEMDQAAIERIAELLAEKTQHTPPDKPVVPPIFKTASTRRRQFGH